MSRIPLTHFWQLAKPYWVIGRIAILVLGSLAYLHFVERFRKFSKASNALEEMDSAQSAWDKRDIIDY